MACLYSPHFLPLGSVASSFPISFIICAALLAPFCISCWLTKVLLPSVLLCIFLCIFSFPTHLSRLSLLLIIVSSASWRADFWSYGGIVCYISNHTLTFKFCTTLSPSACPHQWRHSKPCSLLVSLLLPSRKHPLVLGFRNGVRKGGSFHYRY